MKRKKIAGYFVCAAELADRMAKVVSDDKAAKLINLALLSDAKDFGYISDDARYIKLHNDLVTVTDIDTNRTITVFVIKED